MKRLDGSRGALTEASPPRIGGEPLKQFFSYFGSKVSLAKHYPAPEFQTIIEPFAGSAGYSCLFPDLEIRLYDSDPTICGVWNFLIRATRQDILSLPLDPLEVKSLSIAERDFIGFWWRRCGAVPSLKPVPWMLSGLHPYSFWGEKTRQRIADQVERINHWTCKNAPFNWVLPEAATWFIDPPYQQQGTRYAHGTNRLDYAYLAEWVAAMPGQKIVCEAMGADWLPFRPLYKNRTVKHTKAKRTIQEMIFTESLSVAKPADASEAEQSPSKIVLGEG